MYFCHILLKELGMSYLPQEAGFKDVTEIGHNCLHLPLVIMLSKGSFYELKQGLGPTLGLLYGT